MGRRKLELTSRKRCLVTEDEVSAQQASTRGAEEADPTLSTDLSCCLLLIGEDEASSGIYSPLAYRLRPRGDDLAEHHVMHLHEIHHKALNDDTAWGALIHVAARHPGWTPDFLALLVANCRTVHESFASFMSVSLARTRHHDVDRVFDRYPVYRPLAARFERLLRPFGTAPRELAATGIARWCMSAPVIDLALSAYPEVLTLSAIPSAMRPDHRFRLAVRVDSGQIEAAAAAADRAFRKDNGGEVDTVALTETDAALDTAWGVWEDAFVAHLVASVPRLAALPTLPPNGHLQSAASLTRAAAAGGLTVELPHETDEAPLSDIESVQRLLNATTLALREFPTGSLGVPGARSIWRKCWRSRSERTPACCCMAVECGPRPLVQLWQVTAVDWPTWLPVRSSRSEPHRSRQEEVILHGGDQPRRLRVAGRFVGGTRGRSGLRDRQLLRRGGMATGLASRPPGLAHRRARRSRAGPDGWRRQTAGESGTRLRHLPRSGARRRQSAGVARRRTPACHACPWRRPHSAAVRRPTRRHSGLEA